MTTVVILTGNELRHKYFRTILARDSRFSILASYCEGTEKSLEARTATNPNSSDLEFLHVKARTQSENDFFSDVVNILGDKSNPFIIKKGEINNDNIVNDIYAINPELLICYGTSIIKSSLLKKFEGRFLNVHLGLSPYYRGAGTNVWPLINGEPEMVGATFMHIDAGIDTGRIIHQIRADVMLGDSPHTIGNRLIRKMTQTYCDVIAAFDNLYDEPQPTGEGRLYYIKDFDAAACERLYDNFSKGMIQDFIERGMAASDHPYIVQNRALRNN